MTKEQKGAAYRAHRALLVASNLIAQALASETGKQSPLGFLEGAHDEAQRAVAILDRLTPEEEGS
jgi:hypothetical protein